VAGPRVTATTVPSATCRAPHVALRFSPDGRVHACCVNSHYELGRIGERTITEIWNGPELAELRLALDDADFSLGCQDCAVLVSAGSRQQTHAEQFDRFPAPAPGAPGWPRRLEFALSNTCNLQCVQCNGELSSSIRTQRELRPPLPSPYGEAFFAELAAFLPHVEVAVFIGGEPFLSRECRTVWDLLIERDLRPEVPRCTTPPTARSGTSGSSTTSTLWR
jgi:radical SAM protein with 4Fe4S-binding SPASM domain